MGDKRIENELVETPEDEATTWRKRDTCGYLTVTFLLIALSVGLAKKTNVIGPGKADGAQAEVSSLVGTNASAGFDLTGIQTMGIPNVSTQNLANIVDSCVVSNDYVSTLLGPSVVSYRIDGAVASPLPFPYNFRMNNFLTYKNRVTVTFDILHTAPLETITVLGTTSNYAWNAGQSNSPVVVTEETRQDGKHTIGRVDVLLSEGYNSISIDASDQKLGYTDFMFDGPRVTLFPTRKAVERWFDMYRDVIPTNRNPVAEMHLRQAEEYLRNAPQ